MIVFIAGCWLFGTDKSRAISLLSSVINLKDDLSPTIDRLLVFGNVTLPANVTMFTHSHSS